MTMKHTSSNVLVREKPADFEINTGLGQGDPLSMLLLNLIFELILRNGKMNYSTKVTN